MKKLELYAIYTHNRFNQVLLFHSFSIAQEWARKATRWTEEEIIKNIKVARGGAWSEKGAVSIYDV